MSEGPMRPTDHKVRERVEDLMDVSDGGKAAGLPSGAEETRLCCSSPRDENLDEIQFDLSMDSEAMRRRGLEQLEKALDLIPDEDKVDFVEASHRVPHLVETESDPIRFLRREDFDAWAAASRLVTYWKMRKIIFGDRAFLPLNLSGTGALLPEDVAALETGYIVPLPNDCEGRPVLFYDDTRLGNQDKKQDLCNFFYLLSVVAENPLCQTEGYSVVALMSKVGLPRLNSRQAANKIVDLFEFAMPVRLCTIYLLRKLGNKGFLQTLLPHLFKQFGSYTTTRFTPVFTNSEEETLKKLKTYGLSESGLPQSIGGTWKHETFDQWLIQRRQVDRERSEGSLPGPSDNSSPQPPSAKTVTTRPVSVETVESEEVIQNSLRHFQDALQLIPHEEKTDYLGALERAPSLVQAESDPIRFLRCEDFDAWAAARRLTNYWRHRKALFGERAILPMTQTGEGALTEDDIGLLRTGYMALLPCDDSGHPVFFVDRSRMPVAAANKAKNRVLFYLLQVMSENETSQRDGCIGLYLLSQMAFGRTVNAENFRLSMVLSNAVPVRFKSKHVLCRPPKSNSQSFLETAIPITLRLLKSASGGHIDVHVAKSEQEIRQKLEALSFDARKIPHSLGGSWSYDNVAKWQQDRTEYEMQAYNDSEDHGKGQDASLDVTPSTERRRPAASPSGEKRLLNAPRKVVSVENQESKEEAASEVKNTGSSRAAGTKSASKHDKNATAAVAVPIAAKLPYGLSQLADALDLIPDSEKGDYLAAKDRVPYLVATESDPLRFLQYTDYDPWAAARRLVTYWQQRRAIFGARAFLPMDQTGYGALDEQDLRYLDSGYVVELPKDHEGKTVLFFDRSLEPENANAALAGDCRLRCFFYMMQIASENETSQKDGCLLVVKFKTNVDRSKTRQGGEVLANGVPVRVKAVHYLFCLTEAGEKSYLDMLVFRTIQIYEKYVGKLSRLHVGESELKLFEHLREFGFTRERVPTTLGGAWKYEKHEEWRWQRQEIERERQRKFIRCYAERRNLYTQESASQVTSSRRHSIVTDISLLAGNTFSPFAEADSTEKQALSDLEEAIHLIPETDKRALLEARRLVPDLVNKESDAVRFLRVEKHNPWGAASRLAMYWKVRKETFGERAFLPMSQTGEGTLRRGDINILNNGHLLVLPNDSNGRTVLCFDSSRLSDASKDLASIVRLAFYIGCIAAENEESQKDGYVVVCFLGSTAIDGCIIDLLRRLHSTLPIHVHTIHIVHSHAPLGRGGSETPLYPLMPSLLDETLRLRVIIHRQGSKEELLNDLREHGLSKEGLPKAIGGEWSYEMCAQWQDLRTRFEWDLPTRLKHEKVGKMFQFSVKALSELSEEDKVERKRRLNVLHSRRQRERQRIEVEVLREQVSEMREKNQMLSKKNEQYEQLLEAARAKMTSSAGRHDIDGTVQVGPVAPRLPGVFEAASSQFVGDVHHERDTETPFAVWCGSGEAEDASALLYPVDNRASLYPGSFGIQTSTLPSHSIQLGQRGAFTFGSPSNMVQPPSPQQNTQFMQQQLLQRRSSLGRLMCSSRVAQDEESKEEPHCNYH